MPRLGMWAPAQCAYLHAFLPEMIPVPLCRIGTLCRGLVVGGSQCLPSCNILQPLRLSYSSFSVSLPLSCRCSPFPNQPTLFPFLPFLFVLSRADLTKQIQLPTYPYPTAYFSSLAWGFVYALYLFSLYVNKFFKVPFLIFLILPFPH